eukprot:TRINITY_DN1153_c0_g1_i6.p1 TRINITY_DN1153_c0_g1~~TRINITY_DN1153_c0_g1_i6.p1  ORF type:complete len:578 (-),score=80.93 TRINITY_DN1153_c0_g1_i6:373-2106(-)
MDEFLKKHAQIKNRHNAQDYDTDEEDLSDISSGTESKQSDQNSVSSHSGTSSHAKGKFHFTIGSTVPVHSATEKEFTSYLITVVYPNGETKTILRRFRQFFTLHNAVSKKFPHNVNLPHFPKKRLLSNMSSSLVEKRRKKLENYVQFVASLPGIEDFLAFQTFLGGDLRRRGLKKNRLIGKGNFVSKSSDDEDRSLTDSDDTETMEERERRLATEKRVNEVQAYLRSTEENIEKLKAIEEVFSKVFEKEDFIRVSDYSKIIVYVGKFLESQETEPSFVAKELSKEECDKVRYQKIRSIRQKITPAISELISKLRYINFRLINEMSEEAVKELQDVIEKVNEIFMSVSLVRKALGFRIESGTTNHSREFWVDFMPENTKWYKEYYLGKDHCNYTGIGEVLGPVIVSLVYESEDNQFRAIIRTKNGNRKHLCPASSFSFDCADWKQHSNDILLHIDPQLKDVELSLYDRPGLQNGFLEFESKDMRITNKFKFGIVLCKKDQCREEDMFSNTSGDQDYEEFLKLLGAKVELNNFARFAGGLDCRGGNTTGEHSIFADWENNEIMFHVSTLLPQSDGQQVS